MWKVSPSGAVSQWQLADGASPYSLSVRKGRILVTPLQGHHVLVTPLRGRHVLVTPLRGRHVLVTPLQGHDVLVTPLQGRQLFIYDSQQQLKKKIPLP